MKCGKEKKDNCKPCKALKDKNYRIRNKEKLKAYQKNYRIKNKTILDKKGKIYRDTNKEKFKFAKKEYRKTNLENIILTRAKSSAKKKKIEFNLELSDIFIPEYCPMLGIPIHRTSPNKRSDNSASIDRIDNSKGYTKDNICIISWRANNLKSNGRLEEFESIVAYLKQLLKPSS